jgi:hypothetical protein
VTEPTHVFVPYSNEKHPWASYQHDLGLCFHGSLAGICQRHRLEHPQARPVSDPSETLALMAKHKLRVVPEMFGQWFAAEEYGGDAHGRGPTIGDAVRACVERIKAQE